MIVAAVLVYRRALGETRPTWVRAVHPFCAWMKREAVNKGSDVREPGWCFIVGTNLDLLRLAESADGKR